MNARLNGSSMGSTRGAPQNSHGISRGDAATPRRSKWDALNGLASVLRLAKHVQGASGAEPRDLLRVERVRHLEAVFRAVRVVEHDGEGLPRREAREAHDADLVVLLHLVVVRL